MSKHFDDKNQLKWFIICVLGAGWKNMKFQLLFAGKIIGLIFGYQFCLKKLPLLIRPDLSSLYWDAYKIWYKKIVEFLVNGIVFGLSLKTRDYQFKQRKKNRAVGYIFLAQIFLNLLHFLGFLLKIIISKSSIHVPVVVNLKPDNFYPQFQSITCLTFRQYRLKFLE